MCIPLEAKSFEISINLVFLNFLNSSVSTFSLASNWYKSINVCKASIAFKIFSLCKQIQAIFLVREAEKLGEEEVSPSKTVDRCKPSL